MENVVARHLVNGAGIIVYYYIHFFIFGIIARFILFFLYLIGVLDHGHLFLPVCFFALLVFRGSFDAADKGTLIGRYRR